MAELAAVASIIHNTDCRRRFPSQHQIICLHRDRRQRRQSHPFYLKGCIAHILGAQRSWPSPQERPKISNIFSRGHQNRHCHRYRMFGSVPGNGKGSCGKSPQHQLEARRQDFKGHHGVGAFQVALLAAKVATASKQSGQAQIYVIGNVQCHHLPKTIKACYSSPSNMIYTDALAAPNLHQSTPVKRPSFET